MAKIPGNRFIAVALIVCFMAARNAIALIEPLQPEAVREAYFFGRSSDRAKVMEFLGQYTRRFELRSAGPNAGYIELRTPYQQVVLRSWEKQADYSAQRAQIDYSAQSGLIQVRVYIWLDGAKTGSADLYSDSQGRVLDRRENFWREYRFRVTQEHTMEPKKIEGKPLYSRRGRGLASAEVSLDFDASEFAPREAQVEVIAPDGQTVAVKFPLDQLK
jgi:hypothetical protein